MFFHKSESNSKIQNIDQTSPVPAVLLEPDEGNSVMLTTRAPNEDFPQAQVDGAA